MERLSAGSAAMACAAFNRGSVRMMKVAVALFFARFVLLPFAALAIVWWLS